MMLPILILSPFLALESNALDKTLEAGSVGCEVTKATVDKIEASGIFTRRSVRGYERNLLGYGLSQAE